MIRLLHIRTKEFKEFHDLESVPLYAILSHRWMHAQRNGKYRALELSHAEFLAGTGDDRGYEKIDKACEAVRDLSHKLELELQWIWIDSCCIDKSINEELTEAINSMYEWYAKSYVCIAYLDDADPFDEANPSGWFKRGWTLQELIAPERVLFYNKNWIGCGSRNEYSPGPYGEHSFQDRSQEIATITRIDGTLLKLTKRREIKRRLDSIPACQKMSWASDRETTKDEDMAYCLIGIFDIPHMHLKRGEGRRAFIRLQEEIIKQSNDLTLFAWKLSGNSDDACMDDNCLSLEELKQGAPENAPFFDSYPKSELHGVFACSPSHFRLSSRIGPTQLAVYNDEITITSRGVKLTTPLLGSGPFLPFTMPLYCTDEGSSKVLAIELRLLGGSIYARTNFTQLPQLHKDAKVIPNQDDVFLAHNVHRFQDCVGQMHKHAIRLPESILGHLQRVHVSPGYLWSIKHSLVITNGCRFFVGYANYESRRRSTYGECAVTLLFGLDHLQRPWFCFSNADKSFEPHSLESRKLYLERVWRPASQHPQTAYLDEQKTFSITVRTASSLKYLHGSIGAVRREHCNRGIFDVEFIPAISDTDPEGHTRGYPDILPLVTQLPGFTAGEYPGLPEHFIQPRYPRSGSHHTSIGVTPLPRNFHYTMGAPTFVLSDNIFQSYQPQSDHVQQDSRRIRPHFVPLPAGPRPILHHSASHGDHTPQDTQTQTIVIASDVGEKPPEPPREKNASQGQDQSMRDVERMQNEAGEENPLLESAIVEEQPGDSHTPAIASSKPMA